MTTLPLQLLVWLKSSVIIIVNGGELTNGAAGLTGILPYTSWPVIYFFVVIITILVLNFLRSATGRQAITLREDEIAAESMEC